MFNLRNTFSSIIPDIRNPLTKGKKDTEDKNHGLLENLRQNNSSTDVKQKEFALDF